MEHKLKHIKFSHKTTYNKNYSQYECYCGKQFVAQEAHVKAGKIRSCGCFRRKAASERHTTHGHSKGKTNTPTYWTWKAMKLRCYNPNSEKYPTYGARGITICDQWKNDFSQFLKDMGLRPEGKTIDRIDVDGIYEPSNCRWADRKTQSRNRRINK